MTTKEEIEMIVSFWEEGKGDAKNRLILYNCTSGYPVRRPPSNHPADLSGATWRPDLAESSAPLPRLPPRPPRLTWLPHPTCQVPFDDVCLLELRTLHSLYADRVKCVK